MTEGLLVQYGYVFVFLGSILEGDATLLTASFLANRGYLSLGWVIAVAAAASTLFNETIFHIARRQGKPFLERRAARHKRYAGIQDWVCRRSILLLLVSRYIIGFRMAIPIACGAVGMRPSLFLVVNVAGAVVWTIPVSLAGYLFGGVVATFWHELRHYDWHLATGLIVVVTALLAWFDPELRRFTSLLIQTRHAAAVSVARVRRLLTRVELEQRPAAP